LVPEGNQVMPAMLIRNAYDDVYERFDWPFRPVANDKMERHWIFNWVFYFLDFVRAPSAATLSEPRRIRVQCCWHPHSIGT